MIRWLHDGQPFSEHGLFEVSYLVASTENRIASSVQDFFDFHRLFCVVLQEECNENRFVIVRVRFCRDGPLLVGLRHGSSMTACRIIRLCRCAWSTKSRPSRHLAGKRPKVQRRQFYKIFEMVLRDSRYKYSIERIDRIVFFREDQA